MRRIYLDHNATTPLLNSVYKKLIFTSKKHFGNASSIYLEGRIAKEVMENARNEIAKIFNIKINNIIFTSGATESASTLITKEYFIKNKKILMSHFYCSATEHPCIIKSNNFIDKNITIIPVNNNGIIEENILKNILSKHDYKKGYPLVAIQYANHETGVIQPIFDLYPIITKAKGLLIVDAVQIKRKLDINKCGDFFIISSHKIGGPKGIGAFIRINEEIRPRSLITGGGQEQQIRSGTEPLPLISAFGEAIKLYFIIYKYNYIKKMQNYLEKELQKMIPNVIIYGSKVNRLPNTTYFAIPDVKASTLQIMLDIEGISVSAGSACFSRKFLPSHILKAMGQNYSDGAIRISTGYCTKIKDIKIFLVTLKKIIKNFL